MVLTSLSIIVISLTATIDCSFSGGFEKGLKDFQSGSYGADPDRFCYAISQERRSDFLTAYELGRDNSYLFEKVGMTSIPKDESEFKEIIKEVRALKIQLDAAKTRAAIPPIEIKKEEPQVQKQVEHLPPELNP